MSTLKQFKTEAPKDNPIFTGIVTLPQVTLGNTVSGTGQTITNAVLDDVGYSVSNLGNIGATRLFTYTNGTVFSGTLTANSTFTFSAPPASGIAGMFMIELTNGGAFTITWPASVKWDAGTAPTLSSAGMDILAFYTRDAGASWHGIVCSLGSA